MWTGWRLLTEYLGRPDTLKGFVRGAVFSLRAQGVRALALGFLPEPPVDVACTCDFCGWRTLPPRPMMPRDLLDAMRDELADLPAEFPAPHDPGEP